jgi:hypothetical protein
MVVEAKAGGSLGVSALTGLRARPHLKKTKKVVVGREDR